MRRVSVLLLFVCLGVLSVLTRARVAGADYVPKQAPVGQEPKAEDGKVGKTKINPKDGATMIFIPAGEFLMGDDDMVKYGSLPRHKVTLSGYWIYKDVVTVGMYKKFCQETNRQMPPEPVYGDNHFNSNWSKEDHPIVDVTWDDAEAYCTWAGVTLPTEAQWEKAARGVHGLKFPWGDTFNASKLWASKSQFGDSGGTTSVGRYGVSPYGCTDMAGNVWQWCVGFYDASKTTRNVRGGSWFYYGGFYFRASFRAGLAPGNRHNRVGFRGVAAALPIVSYGAARIRFITVD